MVQLDHMLDMVGRGWASSGINLPHFKICSAKNGAQVEELACRRLEQ